jgi:hypothetical protein
MFAGVDDNINFAGVARNNTYKSDINSSKFAVISKDKPSKTLVEFMENNTQAKKPKENDDNIIEISLQNNIDKAKNNEIKDDNKKGRELNMSCPMNATLADLLT